MEARRVLLRGVLSVILGGCATAAICVYSLAKIGADAERRHRALAASALDQASSLALYLRQIGERDPLGVAIRMLNQTTSERAVTLARVASPKGGEEWLADRWDFRLTRRAPFGEHGVAAWIRGGFEGFLGARSRLENDAFVLSVFLTFTSILYFLGGAAFGGATQPLPESEIVTRARGLLREIALSVREVLRDSQSIAQGTAAVLESCESAFPAVGEAEQAAKALAARLLVCAEVAGQVETAALARLIEVAKTGGLGDERRAQGLAKRAAALRRACGQSATELDALRAKLSEVLARAEDLRASREVTGDTSQRLGGGIARASAALVEQAKLFAGGRG